MQRGAEETLSFAADGITDKLDLVRPALSFTIFSPFDRSRRFIFLLTSRHSNSLRCGLGSDHMTWLRNLRSPYALGNGATYLKGYQKRWAQVHDVRLLATHQMPDRIIERYRDKLSQKAKQSEYGLSLFYRYYELANASLREGLGDLNELKAVYQEKIRSQRQKAISSDSELKPKLSFTSALSQEPPKPVSQTAQASPNPQTFQPPGVKTLSSYIDVPKTLQLPPKEIEYIWRLRHASDPRSLCAVIPYPIYSRVAETARRHPQFILPLPRQGQGAEIHFLQWTFPSPTTTTVLFTHLAEFKLRGEFSQPHTTVTHHLDLAESRDLVLLQGSVMEGRGITVDEGKWLLMCLQKFYGGGDHKVRRRKLLEQFNQGDGGFKVVELLEEAEKPI